MRGLSFLHSRGVVHGDLQSANILFAIHDLCSVPTERLRQKVEDSRIEVLNRLDGKVDKWAPEYLVVAKPLDDYMLPEEDEVVKIIDMESCEYYPKLDIIIKY